MQFHSPSVVQAVPAAIAAPVPVVPDDAELAGAAEVAVAAVVAAGLPDAATVAKTPPERAEVGEAAGATEVAEVTPEVAYVAAGPEPPAVAEPPETAAAQAEPVGVDSADEVAKPSCSTDSPGFGNKRSVESTVPQPFPILATNMFGSAL